LHKGIPLLSNAEEMAGHATRQRVPRVCLLRALLESNHVTRMMRARARARGAYIYIYIYIYNMCMHTRARARAHTHTHLSVKSLKSQRVESRSGSKRLASVRLASRKNPPLKFASRESRAPPIARCPRCTRRGIADCTQHDINAPSSPNHGPERGATYDRRFRTSHVSRRKL